ncbi:MAG: enoyl-CoA hydratase-related protein [Thermoleophilia bacterium]
MPIDVARQETTAILTVNRPEAMNALDVEHMGAIRDRLRELAADDAVKAIVVTGAGEKAFVAGADIKYMQSLTPLEARAWGQLGHEALTLLETMGKVTIAAVNGFALGGGCEVALACDVRLASTNARFGQPEVNLGIFPGWGGTIRLARTTSLGFAKELILTGRMAGAEEARERGLVNHVYEPAELMPQALELAALVAEKSPLALAYAKESTNLALQGDHRSNLETEARLFAMLFGSEDQREGMAAFVEKRKPAFTGR